MLARTLARVAAFFSFVTTVASTVSAQVVLLDGFERGAEGESPPDWYSPPSFPTAAISRDNPHEGEQCAEIVLGPDATFGNMIRTVPLDAMGGKRVRFSAFVQAEGGRAQLWLRFDYDDGRSDLVDNMADRPITGGDWNEYGIVADVRNAPGRAVLGMMVFEGATGRMDNGRLEIVGDALPPEAARPLEGRALANLVAFARLLGYVRFFHPSDEAAACDWETFAIEGVRRVEAADDDAALAAVLGELFAPVAPTVAVYVPDAAPPLHAALSWPEGENHTFVRSWRHVGMGQGKRGIYRSSRERDRVEVGELADGWLAPDEPFVADIGGVLCRVPLTLYGERRQTFPVSGASEAKESSAPAPEQTGDDRGVRLADVVLAWNVFQHFYPYFDVVGVDWPAELERALSAAATDADGVAFVDTLAVMVAALRDGHGRVSAPPAAATGRLPILWDWIEGALVVTTVGPEAGSVALGDVVDAIDGVDADEALAAAEARISGSPQWRRYRALLELATGRFETSVELTIADDGVDEPRKVSLEFGVGPAEGRPATFTELEPGIWYLDLDRLTTEQFLELLPRLEEARGIVFDMRGYPRGLDAFQFFPHVIEETVTSPQWHTPRISRPDRADMEFARSNWTIEPKAPLLSAKKAFLVDGRAISYAESCLGIVEHYGLGVLVGSPTAGANGNVNPFTLPGRYRISWTGMKVLKHDGSQHHLVGVLPTAPVARTRAGVAEGRDEVLEAGLAAVR